jgi:hypothetical protein
MRGLQATSGRPFDEMLFPECEMWKLRSSEAAVPATVLLSTRSRGGLGSLNHLVIYLPAHAAASPGS